MDVVKNIAAIIGCVLSGFSLFTICSAGGRKFIKAIFKKNTEDLQAQEATLASQIQEIQTSLDKVLTKFDGLEAVSQQQCRDTIKNIYYKYYTQQKIPLYERKTADKTFKIYTEQLKGNSYAALLYGEICKWQIEPTGVRDLDEDEEE